MKLRSDDASMYKVQALLCIWGDVNACSAASRMSSHGILLLAWLVELPTATGDGQRDGDSWVDNLALPG